MERTFEIHFHHLTKPREEFLFLCKADDSHLARLGFFVRILSHLQRSVQHFSVMFWLLSYLFMTRRRLYCKSFEKLLNDFHQKKTRTRTQTMYDEIKRLKRLSKYISSTSSPRAWKMYTTVFFSSDEVAEECCRHILFSRGTTVEAKWTRFYLAMQTPFLKS
jgi:hypothetical protein